MKTDLLNQNAINGLAQPLLVRFYGDKDCWWPLYDVDVETGLLRIDVCGLLDIKRFGEVREVRDGEGQLHDADKFYLDEEECGNFSAGSPVS